MILKKRLNVFDYKDYRIYLKDYFSFKKTTSIGFSARNFARSAGFGSHSYLGMVIDGKRNLSLKALKKVSKAIGFDLEETSFFCALALYNQAITEKDKDYYFEKLIELKPVKNIYELEEDGLKYFTNKNYVVIRELVALPGFKEDYKWIKAVLGNGISEEEVKECVESLLRLKLLKRNKEGILELAHGTVESGIDAESLEMFQYHRSIISYAKDMMVAVPHDEREVISVTIPMSLNILEEIKKIMRKCRDDIIKCINKKDKNFDEVFQVNMQMMPVTFVRKEEK